MNPFNLKGMPGMSSSSEKKDIYQEYADHQRRYYQWVNEERKSTPKLGLLPFEELNRKYNTWLKDKNIDKNGNPLPPVPEF